MHKSSHPKSILGLLIEVALVGVGYFSDSWRISGTKIGNIGNWQMPLCVIFGKN